LQLLSFQDQLESTSDEKHMMNVLQCCAMIKDLRYPVVEALTNEHDSMTFTLRAYAEITLKRYDKAVQLFKTRQRDFRIDYYAHYLWAFATFKISQWNECLFHVERSIDLMTDKEGSPLRIQPYLLYASVLSELFQYEEAEQVFVKVTQVLFPKCASGHMMFGKYLLQFNDR
jgi:tetratricopeptide (TPR) repeat protein